MATLWTISISCYIIIIQLIVIVMEPKGLFTMKEGEGEFGSDLDSNVTQIFSCNIYSK